MNGKIFDRETALQRINNEKLFDRYLSISLQDIPFSLDKLEQALTDDNLRSIVFHAHTVKTMAATIGADMLRDAALELERAGKSRDMKAVHRLAGKIRDEFDRFCSIVGEK